MFEVSVGHPDGGLLPWTVAYTALKLRRPALGKGLRQPQPQNLSGSASPEFWHFLGGALE